LSIPEGNVQARERELLDPLNPQQREAVIQTDGPLLIVAGAGSGKTRVITHRIAYLVDVRGVRPERILAVTFTNKAAQEMRERIQTLLSTTSRRLGTPLVSTFHALCVRILRRDAERLNEGFTRNFTIYDADDANKLVKGCMTDLHLDEKMVPVRSVHSAISSAKNRGITAESYESRGGGTGPGAEQRRQAIAAVFKLYEQRKTAANALDFDDLLLKTVVLLRRDEEVREYYNDRFRYIMVDEYQDTNQPQFALVRLLTQQTQNVCVVGDEDQGIYSWRGADIGNILSFEEQYKDAKVIKLEQNYRSTQNILDAAGAVIKNNRERKGKTLWTDREAGDKIRYFNAVDAETESRWVVDRILEARRRQPDARAAVLYRTNSQSRLFEESCRRAGLPYNIVGGFSFYERAEVKDTIAYLKLALNPSDDIALTRIVNTPRRGLGKTTLDALLRHAKDYGVTLWETIAILVDQRKLDGRATSALAGFKNLLESLARKAHELQLSEAVRAAVFDTGLADALKAEATDEAEARLLNLEELVNAAAESEETGESLRDFIDHAALWSDTDEYAGTAPVTLMTMHSAKGLEFPFVFVVGLEEGLFPHARSIDDWKQMEEERRLFYVAITRAEKSLAVSHSMRRRVYGDEMASEPSRFLNELPTELLDDCSFGSSWLSFRNSPTTRQNRAAVEALTRGRNEGPPSPDAQRRPGNFGGATYNSVDSIQDFFAKRGRQVELEGVRSTDRESAQPSRPSKTPSGPPPLNSGSVNPGARVRHPKYGVGLVLKREGSGDDAKLTVTFPGYGAKKFVAKFAQLERA
jgi:DNA helicase II / ATP-dependent DNA helicase PcrA